ncbi:MAG: LPS export ABC transporter permease LptG [Gammaproteobacteria bacterium]|nr:LPS export ABC transporter permease LptG [Gammaproteobacteria bacterium]
MIINRYIQRSIHLGTLAALLLLVSLSLFFLLVRELDDLGQGSYGWVQMLQFLALSVPGKIVEFMPLAVLLGSILSLGALAGNSEVIAMQASGFSLHRMLSAVLQAALLLAVVNFLLADLVVPDSETGAGRLKNLSQENTTALQSREGLWIKDGSRVVHVQALLPNGYARDIEIYQLDQKGKLVSTLHAARAIPVNGGWELQQVRQSLISEQKVVTRDFEQLAYKGSLSEELLRVLMIEPRKMSSMSLYAYLKFLDDNRLDSQVEKLIFWKKLFAPLTIVVMCLLAFPFVLGSQRQASGGQRLLTGILLGLAFVVLDRLLTQLGIQLKIIPLLVALLPNLLFLSLAIYLLIKKQSHGVGIGFFAGAR